MRKGPIVAQKHEGRGRIHISSRFALGLGLPYLVVQRRLFAFPKQSHLLGHGREPG